MALPFWRRSRALGTATVVTGILTGIAMAGATAQERGAATTLAGFTPRSAAGETLTAPAVDSVNTFDAPTTVAPKPRPGEGRGQPADAGAEVRDRHRRAALKDEKRS